MTHVHGGRFLMADTEGSVGYVIPEKPARAVRAMIDGKIVYMSLNSMTGRELYAVRNNLAPEVLAEVREIADVNGAEVLILSKRTHKDLPDEVA